MTEMRCTKDSDRLLLPSDTYRTREGHGCRGYMEHCITQQGLSIMLDLLEDL
jgi:hypothetical protein